MGAVSVLGAPGRRARIAAAPTERKIGVAVLFLVCLAFVVVPLVSSYDTDAFVGLPLQPPSAQHLFGTDNVGRDVFTRTFAGGRIDILIAFLVVGISLVIGTVTGVALGLMRSRVLSEGALRAIDAVLSVPFVILVLLLVLVIGGRSRIAGLPPGVGTIVIAICMVNWAVYARLARTETLTLRDREFFIAARLLGYSRARLVLRHLVPNVIATTLSYAAADAVFVIVGVAGLAFLGAGIQEPTPELGAIMFHGKDYLATSWWLTVMPGVVLLFVVLSLMLIADSFAADD